jgi:hypothetical protein
MRNAGRMKDRRVWLEGCGSTAKGLTVIAVEEQMEKRKLMRMHGQSSRAIMLQLGKDNSIANVFV